VPEQLILECAQSQTGTDGRGISVINPNNSDDVRNRQMGTSWVVFEIEA
jgi:hypothetical protein